MHAVSLLRILLLGLALIGTASAQSSAESKRAEIRKMRTETLAKLHQVHPKAKGAIAGAYGYAVFSNVGINLIFASLATGRGIARDNKAGRDIFMGMGSAGVGLGLGLKDFRGIFVFKTKKAFDDFVNDGWEAGAHADAVAKAGKSGGALEGAISVAPGVELYQLTEAGLAIEATIQGTKYFKDNELNSARK
jgi:lipid-binding SYLF domain-containing protein